MYRSLVLFIAALASALPLQDATASCTQAVCTGACPTAMTVYKTHTVTTKTTTSITTTIYTETCTAATTSTTTLSPGCPISTVAKRDAATAASYQSLCPSSACTCPPAYKTETSTLTSTFTKTKTKTETHKTKSVITPIATSTPAVFYLQATPDDTYLIPTYSDPVYNVALATACSPSALYAINATNQQLYLPAASNYVAANQGIAGAAGLPLTFSDPAVLAEGYTALQCSVNGGALSCSLFGNQFGWENCYGEILLGGSHLCEIVGLEVVQPVFS